MRYRGVSEASHLSTRQGAIQLAPSQGSASLDWGVTKSTTPYDPCGRTSRYRCDHKGRILYRDLIPPVVRGEYAPPTGG